jgi:hypothetical protein
LLFLNKDKKMNVIIYNNGNGVSVVIPTGEVDIDTLIATVLPQGADYSVVDDADLPADRDFRDAWVKVGDAIDHDIEKAQSITKERLRAERAPLLEKLDVDYMKAIEVSADTTTIVAEKQRLRDVTTLVDTATTLDELRGISCQA